MCQPAILVNQQPLSLLQKRGTKVYNRTSLTYDDFVKMNICMLEFCSMNFIDVWWTDLLFILDNVRLHTITLPRNRKRTVFFSSFATFLGTPTIERIFQQHRFLSCGPSFMAENRSCLWLLNQMFALIYRAFGESTVFP